MRLPRDWAISLAGNLQGNAKRPRYLDGAVRPLLGRDSAEKRDIAAARIVNGLCHLAESPWSGLVRLTHHRSFHRIAKALLAFE